MHRSALVLDLGFRNGDEFRKVGDFGGERQVVGFDSRVGLFEFGDQELALVQVNGATVEVEGVPEERLVGETEDQEVARGRAVGERSGYGGEFGSGHVGRGGVGSGGVVEESVGDGGWEWSNEGRGLASGFCGGWHGGVKES